jgi:hypothetical protein
MKKVKLIRKLAGLALISGGAVVPLITTSCSTPTPVNYTSMIETYLDSHVEVLPDPGTTNWTTTTDENMIAYFKTNITVQNLINHLLTLTIFAAGFAPDKYQITYFNCSQASKNDIACDIRVRTIDESGTVENSNTHLSASYIGSKLNITDESTVNGVLQSTTTYVDLQVSEVYKATYEGMFEDSVFVIMNNQTQT